MAGTIRLEVLGREADALTAALAALEVLDAPPSEPSAPVVAEPKVAPEADDAGRVQCPDCDKTFRPQGLGPHRVSKHGVKAGRVARVKPKPKVCGKCGRTIPGGSGWNHERTCTAGEKEATVTVVGGLAGEFQCPECPRTFKMSRGLSRHLNETHGKKRGDSTETVATVTALRDAQHAPPGTPVQPDFGPRQPAPASQSKDEADAAFARATGRIGMPTGKIRTADQRHAFATATDAP